MSAVESPIASFRELSLPAALVQALDDVGYETPTPIQARTIPSLLAGKDLLGHAPTGTGKTAAFALPLLARLDLEQRAVQVMVLTPTRELAIQVAEAFRRYASHLRGFSVVPIYGGQDYGGQIRQLRRGVQVVVGTPGRVMDHMRKGTLKLNKLQALVLDEGDEMLRMGFIDDIEWILEQTPKARQLALFSATMPKAIRSIARRHLQSPLEVTIETKAATADTIRQRYWMVSGLHKLDALTRILEAEPFDAILVFVRTRHATVELAERLEARGHTAAALNGDMPQKQREKMIGRLHSGSLDILVATDVAARGLDVERISHVINYDIPYDTEAYIHRIGRTGRAGRTGDAILFVTPREKRMLHAIEKATRQSIDALTLPTTEMVNNRRIAAFHHSIDETIATGRHEFMQTLLLQYQQEHDMPAIEIAAALATMYLGNRKLLLKPEKSAKKSKHNNGEKSPKTDKPKTDKPKTDKPKTDKPKGDKPKGDKKDKQGHGSDYRDKSLTRGIKPEYSSPDKTTSSSAGQATQANDGMEWFRIAAGSDHDIKPANVVGAIANEAGLDASYIGRIEITPKQTLVELPLGMPKAILRDLRKAWICGQKMNLSRISDTGNTGADKAHTGKSKGKDGAMKINPDARKASKQKRTGPKRKKPKNKGRKKKNRELTQA